VRRFWKAATLFVGVAALPMMTVPAGAVTNFPVSGYGFDGTPHVLVGGGSDTTYPVQIAIASLWQRSSLSGCGPLHNPGGGGNLANEHINECTDNTDNDKNLGNYQGDTIAQANAAGSSAGLRSLVGYDGQTGGLDPSPTIYEGTVNPVPNYGADHSCITPTTGPNVDFARSSGGPTRSGSSRVPGTCGGVGDDLAGMTFWGFARDAITFIAFNNRANVLRSNGFVGLGGITPTDMRKIYDCTYTMWHQVPNLSTQPGFVDGPIVAWTMNNASGTRSTGTKFLTSGTGADPAWVSNTASSNNFPVFDGQPGSASGAGTGPCTQYLVGPQYSGAQSSFGNALDPNAKPLENDTKQLVHAFDTTGLPGDSAGGLGLSTDPNSRQNPENWIWFGSFGVFNAFPYTEKVVNGPGVHIVNAASNTSQITSVAAGFLPINGSIPNPNKVFLNTLPANLGRTLYHVTRKQSADCPSDLEGVPAVATCNFDQAGAAFGPPIPGGNHDLKVVGPVGGVDGAVREYTRFLCRTNNDPNHPTNVEQGLDPLTGVSEDTMLSNAITGAGFTTLNSSLVSTGSRCAVLTSTVQNP
jgi:hypothetical protein